MSLSVQEVKALKKFYQRQGVPTVAALTPPVLLGARGTPQAILGTKPATGAEATIFIDKGLFVRPLWIFIDFVTDAVANNRNVALTIALTIPNITLTLRNSVLQVAGSERTWEWILGYPNAGIDTTFNAGQIYSFLPDLPIRTPVTFSTSTFQFDSGDKFSGGMNLYFEVL